MSEWSRNQKKRLGCKFPTLNTATLIRYTTARMGENKQQSWKRKKKKSEADFFFFFFPSVSVPVFFVVFFVFFLRGWGGGVRDGVYGGEREKRVGRDLRLRKVRNNTNVQSRLRPCKQKDGESKESRTHTHARRRTQTHASPRTRT